MKLRQLEIFQALMHGGTTKNAARLLLVSQPTISNMVKQFEEAGYETDLQYAEDDIPNQLAQIENMITKGVDVLVIAAIDGTTLSNALENAAASGIKVIAYDRLIRDSENVDYYATFDNFKVGVQQATSLVNGLKERFPDQDSWNVELFGGSPDDNNAYFFYNGAMSVLQPMIDDDKINVVSGQMGMDKVGTLRWDGAVAQSRMDNLLSANYTDKQTCTLADDKFYLDADIVKPCEAIADTVTYACDGPSNSRAQCKATGALAPVISTERFTCAVFRPGAVF